MSNPSPHDQAEPQSSNSRPRILFIIDQPNWAHDFKTQNLARVLGNDYNILSRYQTEVTPDDLNRADLIVVYYWLQLKVMRSLLPSFERNRDKLLVGITSNWELERRLRREGLRVLRKWSRAVFVNNLSLYDEYRPSFDVPVFYTPNGVDTEFYRPTLPKAPSPRLRVGWAGSLTNREPGYRSYHELIAPAVKAVDGAELVAAAREDRWRSPEEMREYYRSLDVYVCASHTEGTPNPCLEAAACGVPLLTTPVGNMPELVRDGVNGFFVERRVESIASKLCLLRDDLGLRESLAQNIRQDIRAWDWSIRAQAYKQMFAESLKRRTSITRSSSKSARESQGRRTNSLAGRANIRAVKEALTQKAQRNLSLLPAQFFADHRGLEVTIVMLSHGRLDRTLNAIEAVRNNVRMPFKLILIDNNSDDETQSKLSEVCSGCDFIELTLLKENLGCTGGRTYALNQVRTEYVLFLDNDMEIFPGTVEHLLHHLELNPTVVAAAGNVILPNGLVQLCGGHYWTEDSVLRYKLLGNGRRFDDPSIAKSGTSTWINAGLTMFRADTLRRRPFDSSMDFTRQGYYEDLEWCYCLNQSGKGCFGRNVESLALHHYESKLPGHFTSVAERRNYSIRYVETIAYFYKTHGKIIQSLFSFVPELGSSSRQSILAARILLELVNSRGSNWVLDKWNQGELAPLFAGRSLSARVVRKSKAAVRAFVARLATRHS